jgi:hypothetical protein
MAEDLGADPRAWASERREFGATAREEDLDARIAAADEREAAADEREAAADERLREAGLLDETAAAARARARAERARQRTQRHADQAGRARAREQHAAWAQGQAAADYPLAVRFAELATVLFTAGSVAGVLDHLVVVAGQVIGGVDAVSVTVERNGKFATPAYRGPLALELDLLQYRYGEGPCLDAVADGGPACAECPDVRSGSAWPVFGPAAAAAGGRSVLALGIFPDRGDSLPRLGSLNLYSRQPGVFDEQSRGAGLLLAAHAGVALAAVSALAEASAETAQLRQALESRDVIGQAKGILMERGKLTPEQAFDVLRDASSRLNIKLIEIARQLAETGLVPQSPPRHPRHCR